MVANNIKLNDLENNSEEIENLQANVPADTKIPEVLKSSSSILMPVNFYKFQTATNVTHIGNVLKENEEKKLMNGLSCSLNENDDSFIADLVILNN